MRDTRQRRAIRAVFSNTDRPLTVEEVHAAARQRVRRIGIATVYRTINTLVDDGWLRPVELPGQRTAYERADQPHHHFFSCRVCELVLYGRCDRCADDNAHDAIPGDHAT
jgi:Fur family ferric uptake transcriptional regulator